MGTPDNINVPPDNHKSRPRHASQIPRTHGLAESDLSQEQRQTSYKLSALSRKRKRNEGDENVEISSPQSPEQTPVKRQRTFSSNNINGTALCQATPSGISRGNDNPLQHWVETGVWRKADFEQTSQVIYDFEKGKSAPDSSNQDGEQNEVGPSGGGNPPIGQYGMQTPDQSHRQLRTQSTIEISIHQSSRETNNTRYYNAKYGTYLERKGSHMHPPPSGITKASESLSQNLLEEGTQAFPPGTLFRDDLFNQTRESVQGGSRAMLVRDIHPLICPSIQGLRVYGAQHCNYLSETVDEVWQSIMEYEGPLPQPAYSVGFRHTAFTQEQLAKLQPFVGNPGSEHPTFFMATPSTFFPFFTCEVESGGGALEIADRRNAQSLSMALKALVILFRLAQRENELDRQILCFSISHDHESVRIYGYCPVKVDSGHMLFYRHPLRRFSFAASGGKDKWAAYQFTRNLYDHFAPVLHKMIGSAIDDLDTPVTTASSASDLSSVV